MEPFIDGGLFELLIAIAFGYMINFIFLRKYLLIIFSAISIICPILLLFFKHGEFYYYMVALTIFNSMFLIVLLWQSRLKSPDKVLFDIEKFKSQFLKSNFFRKTQDDKFLNREPQLNEQPHEKYEFYTSRNS